MSHSSSQDLTWKQTSRAGEAAKETTYRGIRITLCRKQDRSYDIFFTGLEEDVDKQKFYDNRRNLASAKLAACRTIDRRISNDDSASHVFEETTDFEETLADEPAAPAPVVVDDDGAQRKLQQLQEIFGGGPDLSKELQKLSNRLSAIEDTGSALHRIEFTPGRPMPEPPAEMICHQQLPDVVALLTQENNTCMVGPAGSGKTTRASQVAETMGLDFYMTGALLQKYEQTGFIDANGIYRSSSFRKAFEDGGLFFWDEIDASNPAALVAFNAALENGHADFPDGTIERSAYFYALAAANTYGRGADRQYVGRSQLDAATIDRFAMVDLDYDETLENTLTGDDEVGRKWSRQIQVWRARMYDQKIRHIISPRASIRGARMLRTGMAQEKVEEYLVWKGLDRDQVKKIKGDK